ncbi:MAG: TMEM165/GDT1 family protein [Planctomycetes bacterium]|nr:TMEM165/GDT1 family protein [Planctomycetota bacterium]
MDWKIFFTSFSTIFIAELGDKTQLMALSMSSQSKSTTEILLGACLALILTTIIGVYAGKFMKDWLPEEYLRYISGGLFVLIGAYILWKGL